MVLATAAEPVFKLHSAKVGRGTSGDFQIVPFYLHRNRALDAFDRNDQVFAAMIVENSFEAVQGPSPYAHALPVAQEGKNGAGRVRFQQALQRLDLAIRNGGGLVRTSGETDYASDLQYGQPLFACGPQAGKYVSREKRSGNGLATIAPMPYLFQQGQKRFPPLHSQKRLYLFLRSQVSLHCIPAAGLWGVRFRRSFEGNSSAI